jgi:hypothetical protein
MLWRYALIGFSIFAASTVLAAEWEQPYPILGSCTKKDSTAFMGANNIPMPYPEWKTRYHDNITIILEDFLGRTAKDHLALRRSSTGPASCFQQREDFASPVVGQIASTLEPWAAGGAPFSQADTVPVLLEYLRVYECSLVERSLSLPVEIWREETDRRGLLPGGLNANPFFFITLWETWSQQSQDIRRELAIARPTLERALGFMGTVHMTRIFERDVECIQRASLDIRNAFALSADAAACMPRIWNAKDPLRDLTACSDGRDNDRDGKIDLEDSSCSSLTDMSE